jgi:hypothetical protein
MSMKISMNINSNKKNDAKFEQNMALADVFIDLLAIKNIA